MTRPSAPLLWATLLLGWLQPVQAADGAPPVDLLVLRPAQEQFVAVEQAVQANLPEQTSLAAVAFDHQDGYEGLRRLVAERRPQVLVVMDNPIIALAKRLADDPDDDLRATPVVATMGIGLQRDLAGIPTICGVGYEVPPFSVITGFQRLTERPIEEVVVFYRPSVFGQFVADAKRQLARAGVELHPIDVEADGGAGDQVRAFLRRHALAEATRLDIDAILLLPDNALLNRANMPLWLDLAKRCRRPLLSGLPQLVDARAGFCTYAAYPDHPGLGHQVAEMVAQLLDGSATPDQIGVEYILAVDHRLDLQTAQHLDLPLLLDRLDEVQISR